MAEQPAPATKTRESEPVVILTDDEIATLNQARTILARAQARTPYTRQGGCVDCALDLAENGIFTALNYLNASSLRPMTHEQLHCHTRPGEAA